VHGILARTHRTHPAGSPLHCTFLAPDGREFSTSGARLKGVHTTVITRGATLNFCSFGHGTASDPVNVANAVAEAGVEAADRAIVQIKEALHGALSGIICDWRFWTRPVSGGFVQYAAAER
jgi:hypothetical protein